MFRNIDVGVQKQEVFCIQFHESPVVSACEASVPAEKHDRDLGEFLSQEFDRAVSGGVVSHNEPGLRPQGPENPGNEHFQKLLPVPVQYDYGSLHRNRSQHVNLQI